MNGQHGRATVGTMVAAALTFALGPLLLVWALLSQGTTRELNQPLIVVALAFTLGFIALVWVASRTAMKAKDEDR